MKNEFAELDIGLINFVSNVSEAKRKGYLRKYLEAGNQKKEEWNISEEVVRLLTLASIESTKSSPTERLIISLGEDKISNIPSTFFQSMLKSDGAFEKEYDSNITTGGFETLVTSLEICSKQKDPDSVNSVLKQVQEYYEQRLDNKIKNGNMDVRQYEPLLDIFINQTEEVKENSKGVTYGTNKKRY